MEILSPPEVPVLAAAVPAPTLVIDEFRAKQIRISLMKEYGWHQKYQAADFSMSQVLLLVSILGSFIATILAASNVAWKGVTAAVAAIPALALTLENTFKYYKRSDWHTVYSIRLWPLIDALDGKTMTLDEIVEKFTELRLEMNSKWPGFTSPPGK